MKARFAALVVAVGFSAGACASTTASQPRGSATQQPTATPTPTSTSTSTSTSASTSTPSTTVTVTVAPTTTPPPPPSTSRATQTSAPSPTAIVSAFYAAINAQDYATAWKLGGANLGAGYDAFAAGFAGTAHDTLVITG